MSDEPENEAEEPKPPKIKAEDNPWYLLATLYGAPDWNDDELQTKNRIAWNRYCAANLDEETRKRLIKEKRHTEEELTPFSPEELQEVERAFAERCGAPKTKFALPGNTVINFLDVEFEQDAWFKGYRFSSHAYFDGAVFAGKASFAGATFSGGATFRGAPFSGGANFGGATFSGRAIFGGATFSGLNLFDGAIFSGAADFEGTTFSGHARFDCATFSRNASFDSAVFSDWADFDRATFSRLADFHGAVFSGRANFGATFGKATSFVNAEMKGETSFEHAKFLREPPRFFGATLHEGTDWPSREAWPIPKHQNEAASFVRAYERLKLEMDRLKKHEDELDFFALELQSRCVLLGAWKGLPIAIYGVLSDYGRSYLRPFVALIYLALIPTLAFLASDPISPWQSLGLSVANTFNVFGFRKDFFEASCIEGLPAVLKFVAAAQTIIGTILLFLFGLGIRNKFRMK